MKFLFSLTLLGLTGTHAFAQAPPTPDLTTILRNQEDMRRELDAMKKKLQASEAENERLKGKERRQVPPAATSTPAAAPAQAGPPKHAEPGWNVELQPWREDGKQLTSLSFPAKPVSDFNFGMHSSYTGAGNRYIYHGYSRFFPREDGEYTFVVNMQPVLVPQPQDLSQMVRFNCSLEFRVNGNRILGGVTRFPHSFIRNNRPVWENQEFIESIRLEPPPPGKGHTLEFLADCWPEPHRTATHYGNLLDDWKSNRFQIRVRTPADAQPRPFRSNELYYTAQP